MLKRPFGLAIFLIASLVHLLILKYKLPQQALFMIPLVFIYNGLKLIASEFGLKIFQQPTGYDFRGLRESVK